MQELQNIINQSEAKFLLGRRRAMRQCIHFMIEHICDEVDLDQLSQASGMSKFHLCRVFQKIFKMTPVRWLWTLRLIMAKEMLMSPRRWTVTDVAFACGFQSTAHFSRVFRGFYGVSPRKIRDEWQAGKGLRQTLCEEQNTLIEKAVEAMSRYRFSDRRSPGLRRFPEINSSIHSPHATRGH